MTFDLTSFSLSSVCSEPLNCEFLFSLYLAALLYQTSDDDDDDEDDDDDVDGFLYANVDFRWVNPSDGSSSPPSVKVLHFTSLYSRVTINLLTRKSPSVLLCLF